jgi:NAD-dependent SIR2 family protein deacetylase
VRGGEHVAQYEAYCVKCKAKREFEGEETTLKNGRRAAKGKCPVCGTTVMRILGKA